MKLYTFRLKTGDDLKKSIEAFTEENNITAGFIVTCVGSLSATVLRMAGAQPDKQDIRTYSGHFEITSLVGTVSTNGYHLHMSVSDQEGLLTGGHLKDGSIVNTTAEPVIGEDDNTAYDRVFDDATGFDELTISSNQ